MPVENPQGDPKAVAEQAILQKLTQVSTQVEQSSQMNKLLAHPGVRAVLEAEAQGRKIAIVDAAELNKPAPADDPFKDIDFDKQVDQKQLAEALLKGSAQHATAAARAAIKAEVEEIVKPLRDKLGQLDGFAVQSTEERTKAEIQAVSEKYANFEDHRQEMINLSKQFPNMSVERLYKLATTESGKGVKLKADVGSERGSQDTPLKSLREVRGKDLPKGARGFDQLLDESLGRQDVSRFEREVPGRRS